MQISLTDEYRRTLTATEKLEIEPEDRDPAASRESVERLIESARELGGEVDKRVQGGRGEAEGRQYDHGLAPDEIYELVKIALSSGAAAVLIRTSRELLRQWVSNRRTREISLESSDGRRVVIKGSYSSRELGDAFAAADCLLAGADESD